MYILPKDLHREPNEVIPYRFDVDIIKECSSLQREIADVFNVIDRDSGTYFTSIERVRVPRKSARLPYLTLFSLFQFTRTANDLLNQYGYDKNILEYIRSYL